jgi:hypothetical protein
MALCIYPYSPCTQSANACLTAGFQPLHLVHIEYDSVVLPAQEATCILFLLEYIETRHENIKTIEELVNNDVWSFRFWDLRLRTIIDS